ncbi:MAG TPA: hypothetical protein VIV12_04480 [Streptosporangiaceae bacterium]
MNVIRRAIALSAAAATAALVTLAASACRGAPSATGITTNGLEKKSPAKGLQEAAGALEAAKSVHIVGTSADGHFDLRMQGSSTTGTLTRTGAQVRITIIGRDGYAKTDQAGLKVMGVPKQVQRHDDGRWLKLPSQGFKGLTLTSFASQLTTYYGPLEPKVRQATLNGRKVVVVSWRDGGKLYIANIGPAYPLRMELKKGPGAGRIDFTEYGARFQITAPRNAINLSNAG